jgi:hypothetical protein
MVLPLDAQGECLVWYDLDSDEIDLNESSLTVLTVSVRWQQLLEQFIK